MIKRKLCRKQIHFILSNLVVINVNWVYTKSIESNQKEETKMNNITITQLPDSKTRSGKTKYEIEVNCKCGWGTKGNNTFSMNHLIDWADKMSEWHMNKDHK
jgi:hypothetical protein